jgi:hypothetical protein
MGCGGGWQEGATNERTGTTGPGKNESGRNLAEEEVTNDPANKGILVGGVKPIILGRSGPAGDRPRGD